MGHNNFGRKSKWWLDARICDRRLAAVMTFNMFIAIAFATAVFQAGTLSGLEVKMDIFITVIIIGLAAAYCGRSIYKKLQPGNGCGCGSGCNSCHHTVGDDCLPEFNNTQPSALKE